MILNYLLILLASLNAGGLIAGIIVISLINDKLKYMQDAEALEHAIEYSLGAIQQTQETAIDILQPHILIPAARANLIPGVQYVLDHAGAQVARRGLTHEMIADRINAAIGLRNIEANIATAATNALSKLPPLPRGRPPPVQR